MEQNFSLLTCHCHFASPLKKIGCVWYSLHTLMSRWERMDGTFHGLIEPLKVDNHAYSPTGFSYKVSGTHKLCGSVFTVKNAFALKGSN